MENVSKSMTATEALQGQEKIEMALRAAMERLMAAVRAILVEE